MPHSMQMEHWVNGEMDVAVHPATRTGALEAPRVACQLGLSL